MLDVAELCCVRKGKGVEKRINIFIYMAIATSAAGTAMAIPHFYSKVLCRIGSLDSAISVAYSDF